MSERAPEDLTFAELVAEVRRLRHKSEELERMLEREEAYGHRLLQEQQALREALAESVQATRDACTVLERIRRNAGDFVLAAPSEKCPKPKCESPSVKEAAICPYDHDLAAPQDRLCRCCDACRAECARDAF